MIAILMALCYMYDSYFVVALLTSWTCCGHRILNAKTFFSILRVLPEVRTTPPRLQGARFDESFVTLELQFDSRVVTRLRFGVTFDMVL